VRVGVEGAAAGGGRAAEQPSFLFVDLLVLVPRVAVLDVSGARRCLDEASGTSA
jgi:hypothetical protein